MTFEDGAVADPERDPYLALCREIGMTHKLVAGDWYWSPPPRGYVACCHGFKLRTSWQQADLIWLPRLDQWLAMLEGAGFLEINIWRTSAGWQMSASKADRWLASGPCPAPEEAAGRLWVASGKG